MKNKFKIMLIIALSFVLMLNIAYASSGITHTHYFFDEQTNSQIHNVDGFLYDCIDDDCTNLGSEVFHHNSDATNVISFEYPSVPSSTYENPVYYYRFFLKECYLPMGAPSGGIYDVEDEYEFEQDVNFKKASSCHSPIESFNVTNDNYVNEPLVVNVSSTLEAVAYSYFLELGYDKIPPGYEEHFSVQTTVTLEILKDGDVVHTDSEDFYIFAGDYENVTFSWTPAEEGDYVARVKTDILDCQCDSSFERSSSKDFNVFEERPNNECYTLLQNLEATPLYPTAGSTINVSFDKISNYADSSFVKTPVDTLINYQITDSSNNVVENGDFVLSANQDGLNYENHLFNWVSTQGGDYNIRIEGVAQSSLCDGLNNSNDVISLGYHIMDVEKYYVDFTVVDSVTNNSIENALVSLGSESGNTNSNGFVNFYVNPENYSYDVTASEYNSSSGTVSVDDNVSILVELVSTEGYYTVQFNVVDASTNFPITDAVVDLNGTTINTNSNGVAIFDNVLPGNYEWSISANNYYDSLGSVMVNDSDVTLDVTLQRRPFLDTIIVDLLYPEGGEVLQDTVEVLWDAESMDNSDLLIDLVYTIDEGETWNFIAEDLENTGNYSWNTNNYPDVANYILKVVAKNPVTNLSAYDESDFFTINNVVVVEDDDDSEEYLRDALSIVGIDFINPYGDVVSAGDSLVINMVVKNTGDTRLNDLKIAAVMNDIAVRDSIGPFNLNNDYDTMRALYLDIPEYVDPGVYPLRITISGEDIRRVVYRDVIVI
ncbi:MAG: collagen binding domain-containing protein [Candidatus Woesearchaeota archaeon]